MVSRKKIRLCHAPAIEPVDTRKQPSKRRLEYKSVGFVRISAKCELHIQIFRSSLSVQVVRFASVLDFHMNFIVFQEILSFVKISNFTKIFLFSCFPRVLCYNAENPSFLYSLQHVQKIILFSSHSFPILCSGVGSSFYGCLNRSFLLCSA